MEKIVGTTYRKCRPLIALLILKDTLFKMLNSEIVTPFKTQDTENHTLLSDTYQFRPNNGVSPRDFVPLSF